MLNKFKLKVVDAIGINAQELKKGIKINDDLNQPDFFGHLFHEPLRG